MDCHLYEDSAEARNELETLCKAWDGHFWPLKEVLLSLKIPGTFLRFLPAEGGWQGLTLGRSFGERTELFFIYVTPQARSQGIGARLMHDFLDYARIHQGAQQVFLEVRPSNLPACRLYLHHGFNEVGRRKRYYQDGEDALIFERDESKEPRA